MTHLLHGKEDPLEVFSFFFFFLFFFALYPSWPRIHCACSVEDGFMGIYDAEKVLLSSFSVSLPTYLVATFECSSRGFKVGWEPLDIQPEDTFVPHVGYSHGNFRLPFSWYSSVIFWRSKTSLKKEDPPQVIFILIIAFLWGNLWINFLINFLSWCLGQVKWKNFSWILN